MRRGVAALFVLAAAWLLSGCVVVGGSSRSNSSGLGAFLLFLLPLVFFFMIFRRARAGGRDHRVGRTVASRARPTPASTSILRAELSVLADDVLRLEPQVTLHPAARDDYEAALQRYRVAQAALNDAEAAVDLRRVQRVVDEATWLMARARATIDGREPPPPPEPLRQPGQTGEPPVDVDEANHPRYVGSRASFQSGWFAFGPGLFGGLLMGPLIGGFGWSDDESGDESTYDEPD